MTAGLAWAGSWLAGGLPDVATTLAAGGWAVAALAAAVALDLRRRLGRAARAEHELRGPLAALSLAAEQVRRGRTGPDLAAVLDAQLDRSRAGLADLAAARGRGRAPLIRRVVPLERIARSTAAGWRPVAARAGRTLRVDWRAGPATVSADRGRLAQALGNVLSNAIEHGDGEVELRGRRVGGAVRIEVANATRAVPAAGEAQGSARPGPREGVVGLDDPPRGRGLVIAAEAVRRSGGTLEVFSNGGGVTAALELPVEEP